MKLLRHLHLVVLACLLGSTVALAAPASENSIRELLAVTQARNMLDGIRSQYEGMMNSSVQQALKGKTPTPTEQRAIDNMKTKMIDLLQGTLSWEKLEPVYVRLYRESFTEEEIAGMLAFYRTAAGKAVIQKMPILMQKSMLETQNTMMAMMPKMQKIQQEFVAEMKPAGK